MIDWIRIGSVGLVFGLTLIGCEQPYEGVTVHPRIEDRPDRERIELFYTNSTKNSLCFDDASWPNSTGTLSFAGDRFALVVDGRRFPVEDRNTGYCIGEKCGASVAPSATIFGFLPYSEFHLPDELRHKEKRLEYSIRAYQCDVSGDWRPKLKPR